MTSLCCGCIPPDSTMLTQGCDLPMREANSSCFHPLITLHSLTMFILATLLLVIYKLIRYNINNF